MVSHVVIRPGVITDAAGVAGVHVASWQAGYAGLLPDEYLGAISVEARTTSWETHLDVSDGGRRTLVAVEGERVLGFASVGHARDEDAPPGIGELWALYTHPDDWGRGVGKALIAAAEVELSARGFVRATLWVLADNDRARRFYEDRGWEIEGQTKVDWRGDVRLDEVRYVRLIDSALPAS